MSGLDFKGSVTRFWQKFAKLATSEQVFWQFLEY